MAKINSMMDIGKRAMMNSQTALQTVAHNIANKNVEGYSRQRVEQQSAIPVIEGRLQLGTGTRAAAVTRTNNPYIEKQLQNETGKLGFEEGRASSLAQIENLFNEQNHKGINQYFSEFFNSFNELSNNPESNTIRTIVRETSTALGNEFGRMDQALTNIQKDLDLTLKTHVQEINAHTREIAALNHEIANSEIQGTNANDQRDRRDLVLKKLNELIDIKWGENPAGTITVSTAGNGILVSGFDSMELSANEDPNTGRTEIFYRPNESIPFTKVTDRIKGGSVGGIVEVRDRSVEEIRGQLHELGDTFVAAVNEAHVKGFDRDGNAGSNFFDFNDSSRGIASGFKLNDEIADDVNRIATAAQPGAIGDNTVAHVIANLQNSEILNGGTSTIDDFYGSQVASIGVSTQRANKSRDNQKNILDQLSNIRESVAGVSLDEETAKMIEHQRAFEASARVIKMADEMFQTILDLKRT